MKFEIKAYSMQELGQRQNQEDSIFPALGKSTDKDRLFILCDGMGGHEKGEVASSTVCEVMSKSILSAWNPAEPLTDEVFQEALSAAYDSLDAKDNGEERKMGTTMTFVCLHADGVTVAHIGDSRVYQLRPAANGNPARIVFRTQDHSLVNDLVKIGEITEEEAKYHPQKNVITRAMQPCQDRRAKADIVHLTDIRPGDYFYMCSDGMLEEATDENILNVIAKPDASDEQKMEILRRVTDENKDNHTAHLIHIYNVEDAVAPTVDPEVKAKTPTDTWVTPEYAIPRRGSNPLRKKNGHLSSLIIAAVVLAIVALTATCFHNKGEKAEEPAACDTSKGGSIKQTTSPQDTTPKPPLPVISSDTTDVSESEDKTVPEGDSVQKKNEDATHVDSSAQVQKNFSPKPANPKVNSKRGVRR